MADIEGKRIVLAKLQENDFSLMHSIWQESNELPENPEAVFALIQKKIKTGKNVCWLIRLKDGGTVLGSCEYNDIDILNNKAYIGCVLKANYRSYGYMTEALDCILQYGFSNMRLDTIRASIKMGNTSSIKLFERLEFKPCLQDMQDLSLNMLQFARSRFDAGI